MGQNNEVIRQMDDKRKRSAGQSADSKVATLSPNEISLANTILLRLPFPNCLVLGQKNVTERDKKMIRKNRQTKNRPLNQDGFFYSNNNIYT